MTSHSLFVFTGADLSAILYPLCFALGVCGGFLFSSLLRSLGCRR